MSKILWKPSASCIANAHITHFVSELQKKHGLYFQDYPGLHQWSIQSPDQFWKAVWEYLDIRNTRKADTVLRHEPRYISPTFSDYRWFEGARLNFAENLLRFADLETDTEKIALISYLENGRRRSISYQQLSQSVAQLAAALRADGVQAGDRVAALMPNVIETVIAMLATASIGAIWSSCSPDFGLQGVLDRFGQIEPKIMFVADGYFYNGKAISLDERIAELESKLVSVEKIIIVSVLAEDVPHKTDSRKTLFSEYIRPFLPVHHADFVQLPFDHPLYILYSSGTTGIPKCIVHSAGGTLLQHLKELVLHTDIHPESVLFYFTTCGWMMWNWLVSGLATGCTVVLYDGSPLAAHGHILWDIAEKEGITHFGASAKYFAALEKIGFTSNAYTLSALQTVLSTGSPLSPESFEYIYRDIKKDICVSSICGGTDIVSSFILGNACLPVYAGEIQCKGLGMAVDIFDENSRSVVGEKGELVCTVSFPSCPIGFWNDPDGEKFHAAYFSANKDVWTHGDYAEITEHNGIIVHGRSDAVLNPGGVRIGTAEIYRQVEKLNDIVDSIVIGQNWKNDVRIILFVVLREGIQLDDTLRDHIRQIIRSNATPRHVPEKIIQIDEVPRTISGKIVELAVRNVIHNLPVKNTDALANPDTLEQFRDLKELKY